MPPSSPLHPHPSPSSRPCKRLHLSHDFALSKMSHGLPPIRHGRGAVAQEEGARKRNAPPPLSFVLAIFAITHSSMAAFWKYHQTFQAMWGFVSQPHSATLFRTAPANYPDVKEKEPLMLKKKNARLQSKTLHQASIKACTSLSRLIVFPCTSELRGIRNDLIQESNYRKQGVLLWIVPTRLSTQAINELSKTSAARRGGTQVHVSTAAPAPARLCGTCAHKPRRPQSRRTDSSLFFILTSHSIWNMCWKKQRGF